MLKFADDSTNEEKPTTSSPTVLNVCRQKNRIFFLQPTPSLATRIKESQSLPDPAYYQALKRNPNAKFYLSKYVKYYQEDRGVGILAIGRGNWDRVKTLERRGRYKLRVEDRRIQRPLLDKVKSSIRLRPYQVGTTDKLIAQSGGILRADTGAGKTIMALDLFARLRQRTLIVVPKLDLVNQFKDEFEKYIKGATLGIIQGQTTTIGDLTIATIQSLRRRIADGKVDPDEFGAMIVDECHLTVPQKSRAVIQYFNPYYLYGMTATARRTDEQGEAIGFMYGEILADIKVSRAKPEVEIITNTSHIFIDEYYRMIDAMVNDWERNNLICDIIEREVPKGRKILVLTKRINHYETIKQMLDDRGVVHSKSIIKFASNLKKEKRDKVLSGLRSGDLDFSVMVGTFSLLSTGIDVPALDTLIVAGDLKSDVLTEQSAGRILRLLDGKDPKIIDIWDTNNYILKRQGKLRQEFYASQDWPLTNNS